MKKLKKYSVVFTLGGVGYGIIEIIWRGYTHWTMIFAGGICFIIFSLVAEKLKAKSLWYKAALCSVGVTAVEFVFGIIFNIILKMNVWDYSNMPFNILGQICLLYTLFWGILGLAFVPIAGLLNKKLQA